MKNNKKNKTAAFNKLNLYQEYLLKIDSLISTTKELSDDLVKFRLKIEEDSNPFNFDVKINGRYIIEAPDSYIFGSKENVKPTDKNVFKKRKINIKGEKILGYI